MSAPVIDPAILSRILAAQRAEITEYRIYSLLAFSTSDPHNRDVLMDIATEEHAHYEIWKGYTGKDVSPSNFRVWYYCIMAWVLGITFTLKLMEHVERSAQNADPLTLAAILEYSGIIANEENHEKQLIAVAGLIMGIAASEYLSQRSDGGPAILQRLRFIPGLPM